MSARRCGKGLTSSALDVVASPAGRQWPHVRPTRAYTFDADAFDEVARWIALERRCRPFPTVALALSPAEDALRRCLTGPAGTRAFLDAELPTPSARSTVTRAIIIR